MKKDENAQKIMHHCTVFCAKYMGFVTLIFIITLVNIWGVGGFYLKPYKLKVPNPPQSIGG